MMANTPNISEGKGHRIMGAVSEKGKSMVRAPKKTTNHQLS